MKLERLIKELESCKSDAQVRYDFCDLVPTRLGSYRGYYDQLALGWEVLEYQKNEMPVSELLDLLRGAVNETYSGWKGGEYTMTGQTEVWVANQGRCHGTTISGVDNRDWQVILETKNVD